MKFNLTFNMDNSAFEDHPATEAGRILRQVAAKVLDGDSSGTVMDQNGNTVGTWEVSECP